MMSLIRKIRRTGLLYTVGIAINRIVPQWLMRFRTFKVFELDAARFAQEDSAGNLPQDNRMSDGAPFNSQIASTENELVAIRQLTQMDERLNSGKFEAAFIQDDANTINAGVWAAHEQFDELDLGLRIQLAGNQAWLCAAMVDKRFRRQGLYSGLLAFFGRHLLAAGSTGMLLAINTANRASIAAHQRYIKDACGRVLVLRIFNVAICCSWGERVSHDRWLTWSAKDRPIVIRIDAPLPESTAFGRADDA